MAEQTFLEQAIDKVFSLKQRTRWLIGIVILGFILRAIAMRNISDSADSMHFVTHAINFFSAGRLETYDQSSGLWFVLTSVFYKIFGIIPFAARLSSLLFGTATILAVYLLAKEFFSEKISLMSAFLTAVAPFHLMNTSAEMDVMTMFFSIVAMALFVRAMRLDKGIYYAIAGIFLGLAIYTKVYPLLFVPSLLLYAGYVTYMQRKPFFTRRNVKHLALFLGCAAVFAIPALAHNYLLYQDKGILDLEFARVLGLGREKAAQYYSFDPIWNEKSDWRGFFLGNAKQSGGSPLPLFLLVMSFILRPSPLIFVLGVLGVLWMFVSRKQKNTYAPFFVLSILFIFPFLGSIILLSKHYLFLELLLIPAAAFFLEQILQRISAVTKRDVTSFFVGGILLFTALWLTTPLPGAFAHFYGENYVSQVIDYKNANIPADALIVADSRIYRGQIHWMFQERKYLEAAEFMQVYNQQDLPGIPIPMNVYYVECVYDDCGWGTVAGQPEFNASMESLTAAFQQSGTLLTTISEPDKRHPYFPMFTEKIPAIRIYQTQLTLKDSVLKVADQPKNWFLYYIGYPQPAREFDAYTPRTAFASAVEILAQLMVRIALVLAFVSILYVGYLGFRETEKQ